jgi:hypothetical protein
MTPLQLQEFQMYQFAVSEMRRYQKRIKTAVKRRLPICEQDKRNARKWEREVDKFESKLTKEQKQILIF